jgi:hypothetical protein
VHAVVLPLPSLLLAAQLLTGQMLPLSVCQEIPTHFRFLRPYFLKPGNANIDLIIKRITVSHLFYGLAVGGVFA